MIALTTLGPLLSALLLTSPEPELAQRVAPRIDGAAELILIGDTGEPGELVDRWTRTLQTEPASAILVLGDLVYPQVPPCPRGRPDPSARRMLESHVAKPFRAIGKQTFLLIGNHDVAWVEREPRRERCVLAHFQRDPAVRLPALHYALDLGPARLVVLNTTVLDDGASADPKAADAQAAFAKAHLEAARKAGQRVVFAGHHTLKTYHDKIAEDLVRPWLAKHGLTPDLWVNGHAHILQLGIYDGLPAVTSGSAAKPRVRPDCDREANTGACGDGQLWGSSTPGYAVLEVGPASAGARFTLTFKDVDGRALHTWREPPRTTP